MHQVLLAKLSAFEDSAEHLGMIPTPTLPTPHSLLPYNAFIDKISGKQQSHMQTARDYVIADSARSRVFPSSRLQTNTHAQNTRILNPFTAFLFHTR